MENKHKVGSTWSKWDLHVHSPASIVHNYPGNHEDAWEAFIDDLEKLSGDFKALGINDYIFVDGYERVLKAKKDGRLKNIDLILPVIELRLDKFAGVVKKNKDGTYSKSDWNRINLHIIFDQLDPEVIRQQFLSSLIQGYQLIPESGDFRGKWQAVITRDSLTTLGQMIIDAAPPEKQAAYSGPLQEGFNNLCISLESVQNALDRHDLKDRYLLAVGKTEWDNMKWDDQSIAEKRNIINCVDLVFTASPNPDAYIKAKKKLTEANVLDKLLDCSDAHALSESESKDRIGNCFTWIKANPTFQGLVQAVTEYEQRVFIGDVPPKKLLVKSNRTKYVSSISIKKKSGLPPADLWFDLDIPLNHDLVAIIGNKGSGKSALADVVALAGDTKNYSGFSFLNDDRFCDPKNNLASQFTTTLTWHDDTQISKDLHETPEPSNVERIKYLPQSYIETLCNELAGNGSSTFDSELRKIIYTHVPDELRIGFNSLDELLDFKISELEQERKQLIFELSKINSEIVSIEHKLSPEFRRSLEQQLDAKRGELVALEGAKPSPVNNPEDSEIAKHEAATATTQLTNAEEILNKIRAAEQIAREKKAAAIKGAAHVTRILQAITNHEKSHNQFLTELNTMLGEVDSELKAKDIASLVIDLTGIERLSIEYKRESDAQDRLLTDSSDSGLLRRREEAEKFIQNIKSQLDEKQRLFLVYRRQLAEWEQAIIDIKGNKEKINTIAWYESEIVALDGLPDQRSDLKKMRLDITRRLHEQIQKIVDEYRVLYEPVQAFVQSTARMDMTLPLSFNARISEEGFQDNFIARINRQARGSFSGVDESNIALRRLLKGTDFSSIDEALEFVEKIDDMLHFDRRPDVIHITELSVIDQMRKEYRDRPEEFYDYIYGLSYLKPQYSLNYDGQGISKLSPGERGLLLLVFYLLVDNDNIPLVIDQPEENLDNQTIFKILVKCIKVAKQTRQLIMVTHNPNLAVVCDAEQIICAKCDKINKRFSYISGAIESPEIKTRVIEILEGTEPAFVNRKLKYGFK